VTHFNCTWETFMYVCLCVCACLACPNKPNDRPTVFSTDSKWPTPWLLIGRWQNCLGIYTQFLLPILWPEWRRFLHIDFWTLTQHKLIIEWKKYNNCWKKHFYVTEFFVMFLPWMLARCTYARCDRVMHCGTMKIVRKYIAERNGRRQCLNFNCKTRFFTG
jgi:hypothetical protein